MRKIILAILLALTIISSPVISSPATGYFPEQNREDKKEETVYITRTGERYHRGSCHHLRRSKIPVKKSDAIAQGYTPCKVCRP